jgi:hypothetical protein
VRTPLSRLRKANSALARKVRAVGAGHWQLMQHSAVSPVACMHTPRHQAAVSANHGPNFSILFATWVPTFLVQVPTLTRMSHTYTV